jgi:hypothetical protein
MITVFDNAALLPADWRNEDALRTARVFNPALLRDNSGWLLAYRVVTERDARRRIALCRLDAALRIIDGTQEPLTDRVHFPVPEHYAPQAATWFADPRLYRLSGRLFVHWNSGWHEPKNHQFLQELDSATLHPVGVPREFVLRGARQELEKNWTLFESQGLHAVYSVNPHRVLNFSINGTGPIEFSDFGLPIPNETGHAQRHGGLRGGAPPQAYDGHFYSFCHSIEDGPNGYRYVASVYRFAATPPFAPVDMPAMPLPIDVPTEARRRLPKLNPAVGDVIYPAGAAMGDGRWLVSIGIDDERAAIVTLSHDDILRTLAPVKHSKP